MLIFKSHITRFEIHAKLTGRNTLLFEVPGLVVHGKDERFLTIFKVSETCLYAREIGRIARLLSEWREYCADRSHGCCDAELLTFGKNGNREHLCLGGCSIADAIPTERRVKSGFNDTPHGLLLSEGELHRNSAIECLGYEAATILSESEIIHSGTNFNCYSAKVRIRYAMLWTKLSATEGEAHAGHGGEVVADTVVERVKSVGSIGTVFQAYSIIRILAQFFT